MESKSVVWKNFDNIVHCVKGTFASQVNSDEIFLEVLKQNFKIIAQRRQIETKLYEASKSFEDEVRRILFEELNQEDAVPSIEQETSADDNSDEVTSQNRANNYSQTETHLSRMGLDSSFEISLRLEEELEDDFATQLNDVNRISSPTERLSCEICCREFKRKQILLWHKIYEHSSDRRPHKCPNCSKYFKLRSDVRSHLRLVHTKSFKCARCFRLFKQQCTLNQHIRLKHAQLMTKNYLSRTTPIILLIDGNHTSSQQA